MSYDEPVAFGFHIFCERFGAVHIHMAEIEPDGVGGVDTMYINRIAKAPSKRPKKRITENHKLIEK